MDSALTAIESELLERDRSFERPAVAKYFSERFVSLLVHGVFRIEGDTIRGVSEVVESLTAGRGNAASELLRRLAVGWRMEDSRNGLMRRLRELVLDRATRAGLSKEDTRAIDRIAGSYFLIDVPDVRSAVVEQVAARLGGEKWTP